MARSRFPPRGWAALQQLLIVLLVQLEMMPCNAMNTDYCITDVDIERNQIRLGSSSLGAEEIPAIFVGQRWHKFSLLSIIRYIYLEPSDQLQSPPIRVCDDTDETDIDCSADNSSDAVTTNIIASASANYLALGPIAWDLVTLGFMDLSERTNVTTIVLPWPPCPERAEIINRNIFKLVCKY